MIWKNWKGGKSRVDLMLRKMVYQGPDLGRIVTRNGSRPVLLKLEHKEGMHAKCRVSCPHRKSLLVHERGIVGITPHFISTLITTCSFPLMATPFLISSTKQARTSTSVIFVVWQEEAAKRLIEVVLLFLRESKQSEENVQGVQEQKERKQ